MDENTLRAAGITDTKTYLKAVDALYNNEARFASEAAPIFLAMGWKWATVTGVNGTGIPDEMDIAGTVSQLIWECIKTPNPRGNMASTGRISVSIREGQRGWISEIVLCPVALRSY